MLQSTIRCAANNITDNYEYLAKLKNTSESFGNAEQQYPIENVFDYHTVSILRYYNSVKSL